MDDAIRTTPQTAVAAGEGFTSATAGPGGPSDPGPASSSRPDGRVAAADRRPAVPQQDGATAVRDRAADDAAGGTPDDLRRQLECVVARDRVLTRPAELVMYASDASVYRMMPRAVVLADGVEEVRALFALSRRTGVPMTFRAAGTSLSGQAQSDGILVEVARHWRGVTVEDHGRRVRVRPGTIAGRVNLALAKHGRKLGPDPASISACTMGGVLANNSSGMCCGVEQNAYRTLSSLTFVLPSGTVVDTAAPDAAAAFSHAEPDLVQGLHELREELHADADLLARVREKYTRKNTTGYSLNAFVDHEEPLDVFAHLLVGSEGTLAFIAEAVLDTVPVLPHKTTGLLMFPSLHAAGAAIVPLREAGATAVELLDRPSLRAVERLAGVPAYLPDLPDGAAALLVDLATADAEELPGLEERAQALVDGFELVVPGEFTRDTAVADAVLGGAQRPVHLGRRRAADRDVGAARGRHLPGRAARRRGRRPGRAVRALRLRGGRGLRPRQGRQPALPAHAVARTAPRRSSATRGSWTTWPSSSSTATTGRSRASTGPAATSHRSSSTSGASTRTRSCVGSRRCAIRSTCSTPARS